MRFLRSTFALLACFAFLGAATGASAQVVTTAPAFPTLGQPLTVTFDASQGTGGLQSYTGDVYAHTGVITDQSTSGSDWKYVKTNWGQNTPETKLTRDASDPDLYRLTISDIRAYYGVPESEEIEQVTFVFRSGQPAAGGGYLEGKDDGGNDIYVQVYTQSLNVRFEVPASDPLQPNIFERGDSFDIEAVASVTDAERSVSSITLFQNSQLVATETGSETLTYAFTAEESGKTTFTVVAEDDQGVQATDVTYVVVNPDVTDAPRPLQEGVPVQDGITYSPDGTSATLSLFAPYKDNVYVIGDFNGWAIDTDYFMKRDVVDEDNVYWHLTIDDLTPGEEYGFQYLVDGEIRVADPYAVKVLKEGEDDEIRNLGLYPDLKQYPTGLTRFSVGVLQPGKAAYTFSDFTPPAARELVIYELLLRDFFEEENLGGRSFYQALADTLGYLQALGVNTIQLMPIQEFDGNRSWGYNPSFHLALDKYYGPADHFAAFVEAAHQRDMAVVLDVVYNHATGDSPLIRLYNEGDFGSPTSENPYANQSARHPFNVFNDLDHESPATQYWMDRALRYWVQTFDVDGFRFDLSKGFTQKPTNDVGAWSSYDASRVALLKRMADQIWNDDPNTLVILEHFAAQSEEVELTAYRAGETQPGGTIQGMFSWNHVNRAFSQLTMGYPTSTDFSNDISSVYWGRDSDGDGRNFVVPNAISYMESHDEQWLMFRNIAYGNSGGGYNVKNLATALDRQEMAGALFLLSPGPRMIWQFGELGYGYGDAGEQCLNENGSEGECPAAAPDRVGEKPVRWDYYSDTDRRDLYDTWSALLELRNNNPVFTDAGTEVTLNLDGGQVTRSFQLSLGGTHVTVVANVSITPQTAIVPFPADGVYTDQFSDLSVTASGGTAAVNLAPGGWHVFSNTTLSVDVEDAAETPASFGIDAAYPNPFASATTVDYHVESAGAARVRVFDALGRQVATLADGPHAPGPHSARFDGNALPSGVYFVRLESGGRASARTLLLVK